MTHAFREAVAAFRRAPLLTGLSALMVGLALFVVGLFGLAAHNLHLALESVEERVEVVAYVRDGTNPAEISAATDQLLSLPEVRNVRYVSKEQALETAQRDLPEFQEIFIDLEVNPLPASLEVELRSGSRGPEAVDRVASRAGTYTFVEDVRYGQEWVDKLFSLRKIAGVTAMVLGGAFAAVAALIIATAVRIAIFARREEIYIMRLVGARNGFIRRPFLLEGAMTGLLGGLLAVLLSWGTYRIVLEVLEFNLSWIPASWVVAGILAGSAFGLVSSGLALRRYLREV